MSYYRLGMSVQPGNILPERFRHLVQGAQDFQTGANRFYDSGVMIGSTELVGAASGTFLGTMADGIVAIILDVVHVLLMVGGALFIFRSFKVPG
jgi:hypothetical protein